RRSAAGLENGSRRVGFTATAPCALLSSREAKITDGMQRIQGIAVSPGVAIGEALVMDTEGFRIPRRFVAADAVSDELIRLDHAIESASGEVRQNREAVARQLGEQYAAIFDAHLQILHDPKLRSELDELI